MNKLANSPHSTVPMVSVVLRAASPKSSPSPLAASHFPPCVPMFPVLVHVPVLIPPTHSYAVTERVFLPVFAAVEVSYAMRMSPADLLLSPSAAHEAFWCASSDWLKM